MFMRIHESEKSIVLALCDKELIGKSYSSGGLHLDLKSYAYFYRGRQVGEELAKAAMADATSLNLVGKKSVGIAEKLGLVSKKEIKRIGGIPHAQVYRL